MRNLNPSSLAIALVIAITAIFLPSGPIGTSTAAASSQPYLPADGLVDTGGSIRTSETTLAKFPRIGELFYRLSTDSNQAQVVGYNRQMTLSAGALARIEIPAEVSFTADYLATLSGTGLTSSELRSFAGSYSVTSIGPSALSIFKASNESSEIRVLLDEVSLPDTLKVIGADGLKGQCRITSLVVPDSVTDIAAWALSRMSKNNPEYPDCSTEPGLAALTLGTGVERVGNSAFDRDEQLTDVSFRGSVFGPTSGVAYLPPTYEAWEMSAASFTGQNNSNQSCSTRFTYVYSLTLKVVAGNEAGWSTWASEGNCLPNYTVSATAFAPIVPIAPVAASPTDASIGLEFVAPNSLGGGVIEEYEVLIMPSGATQSLGVSTASPATITGLSPGTTYTFKIRARNSIGWSQYSPQSNAVTTLDAPSGLVAPTASSASTTEISLAFLAPGNLGGAPSILEYEVMVLPDGSTRSLGVSTASPATISGLTPSATYSFKIRARNIAGWSSYSGASNELMTLASATGLTAPTASNPTSQSVVLNFEPPSSDGGSGILEYEFKAYPTGVTMSLSVDTSSPMVFTGLTSSTAYTFTFRARNSNGWSLESSASNMITTLTINGSAPQQNAPLSPPQAAYQGPIPSSITSECIPEGVIRTATLKGTRLSTIYAAEVDGFSITISQATKTELVMQIPSLVAGIYDVVYYSDYGKLTHLKSLKICAGIVKAADTDSNSTSSATSSSLAPKAIQTNVTIYFSGDSSILTAKAKQTLDRFAKSLKGGSKTSVVIEGFVRRTAITSYDMDLSAKRANAVVKYLKTIGLKAQFKPIPRGISPEDSPRARKAVLRASSF